MTAPIITFFNNKSGVGNTSLVYHLAWMFADMGVRVLTLDLDPQADLTTAFIDEDRLELLMGDGEASTIFTCVQPVLDGTGSLLTPSLEYVTDSLALLAGDLTLSKYEQELSQEWPKCLDKNERSFLVTTAFWRLMRMSAGKMEANLILVDVGPNLGAINRAAMVATDYVVVPLSPDILSIKGLESLGPTLREWRKNWAQLRACAPPQVQELPGGDMQPIGYIIRQRSVRLDRPITAYDKWLRRIPQEYHHAVLEDDQSNADNKADEQCLARLKHYHSLMPMAHEARKPIFHLKPADGAIGAHMTAVQEVKRDFELLAREIAGRIGLPLYHPAVNRDR